MIHWVDQRLRAWGVWVQQDCGQGSAGLASSWGQPGGSSFRAAVVPVRNLACSRTDDWVKARGQEDQLLLLEHYCTPRTSVEQAARLKMSLRTLYRRLHELHTQFAVDVDQAAKSHTRALAPVAAGRPFVVRALSPADKARRKRNLGE